ncbi:evolved beta-galactosidase subunit alpha [bacterium BMS3Bbin04]|nr:evolved beta-galactosidase subunit alpha [bacterium BMS3Bbin04]
MYTLNIIISDGEGSFGVPITVGFREIKWESGQVLLNGNALEIRGIDYRQESHGVGAAISTEQIERDLTRIRNQGFNLVRVTGSVPHPATYDICDRLGLMLLPGTGLRGVPIGLMTQPAFRSRLESMLRREILSNDHHPSVLGWEMVDWAPYSPTLLEIAIEVRSTVLAGRDEALFIGFASDVAQDLPDGIVGMRNRIPYLFEERVTPQSVSHGAWLAAGLGALASPLTLDEDSLQSEIRQSDALVRQVNAIRELPLAGFIIDSYNDRRAALPMLIAGAQLETDLIRRGLVTEGREERISWQRVGDLLGQVQIDVPVVESPKVQFPVEFPIATLIIGGILLLMMRQNNVFRHNLRRVFAHTHGFFADIVDRRYFQGGQTMLVAIIFATAQGVLLASLLNHSRFYFGLDYLFTLIIPFYQAKALLVYWAWHPIYAILAFSAIVLVLWIVGAVALRLLSIPFPGQMKLRHSLALIFWAATCFLPLIPLGLVHYRLLDFAWFKWVQISLFGLFWFWFLIRVSSVIRVGFRVSSRTAWILIFIIILVTAGSLVTVYRGGFAITDYIRYYSDVILPWIEGPA